MGGHIVYTLMVPMFAQHVNKIVTGLNPVMGKDFVCNGIPNSRISQNAMYLSQCGARKG